jgi:nitrogen fixation protein FixH
MSAALTGRRVAVIAAALSALVLVPNVVLIVTSARTFSGVVANSYLASQDFDRARAAQEALGWRIAITHADGALRLDLADAAGRPVRPAAIAVTLGRPATTRDDRPATLTRTPTGYAAAAPLAHGHWRVEVAATAADGTAFRQSRDILVRP